MSTPLTLPPSESLGIRLSEILPNARVVGAKEIVVESCCGAWQDCQTNDLFVAIADAEHDGHEFTHEAIARGASAIVTERLLTTRRPQCIVPDTREAYGKICQALAGHPSRQLATMAVSGSDGKTVTSHLLRHVLNAAGIDSGLSSSIETDLGSSSAASQLAPINAPQLAEQLTRMALSNCGAAVLEVPSIALAQRCLAGVELDLAVLTNIRLHDLNYHGSSRNYRRAQTRVLRHLKPDGVAVINADDPTSHFLLERIKSPTLTYGIKQEAHVTGRLVERSPSEQTFLMMAGSDSVAVRTDIVGDQHIYNCLAAATAGLARGIDLVTIAAGLEKAARIPGRLERVECGQPFGVWIDSARTDNQLATAVRSIAQVCEGQVWCVGSVDHRQSPEQRRRMGEILEQAAGQAILTGCSLQADVDYEPWHQILDGMEYPERARLMPNRFHAIEWALQQAGPDDAVLITGCGERPFARVGDHDWTITDRDVCEAWLYDGASLAPRQEQPTTPSIYHIDDYR